MTKKLLVLVGLYRPNYVGDIIPISTGVIVVPLLLFFELVVFWFLQNAFPRTARFPDLNFAFAVLVVMMTLLGLMDDAWGDRSIGGFRGHFGALLKGRVTTGVVKAIGGGLVCLYVSFRVSTEVSLVMILMDALILALAVNIFNLFDLRPGRALKIFFLALVMLVLFTYTSEFWIFASIILGAAFVLFPSDIGGRTMLGDAGSNVLGAVVGFGLITTLGTTPRIVSFIILLVLNAASEKWSFTRIIENAPLLDWLDRLGRRT
jgi:hypothetical protein